LIEAAAPGSRKAMGEAQPADSRLISCNRPTTGQVIAALSILVLGFAVIHK
jgi:hypothetical protein